MKTINLNSPGVSQSLVRSSLLNIVSAFFGVLLCFTFCPHSQAQVNLPVLGNAISGTVSSQQEYEFGREFLRQIRREAPLYDDPLLMDYIQSLTYKLAANSELTDHRLEFALIDEEQINAFAAPGGIIGVNAGIFLNAEREGQLASVLAHELAHISQRHYARRVEQQKNNTLPNMAGLLASLVIMATAGGEAGQAALMTNQAIGVNNQLRFSRSNEQEADSIGIRTLYQAGFDPQDMVAMFELMLKGRGGAERLPEFMLTHPLDENRIANSRNRANSMPLVQKQSSLQFLLMRERVLVNYSKNLQSLIEDHKMQLSNKRDLLKEESLALYYGIAQSLLKSDRLIEAVQISDELFSANPTNIAFALQSAEIAAASDRLPRALAILTDQLAINPGNNPLTLAYAKVLEQDKQFNKAAKVLLDHSLKATDAQRSDINLWFQLAEIQGRAGNISGLHQARAEYFICIGDFTRSKEQLSLALKIESDKLTQARIRQRQDYIREIESKFYR